MQSHTRSPAEIFGFHARYVVPLFQRPYVWNQDDQWAPLWEDVRTIAERLLDAEPQPFAASPVAPHFLGAIVVEQQSGVVGFIAVWHVVDGQQRLTTLQLILDAAQEVVEMHGADVDAKALRVLVLNEPDITQHADEVYKVWPTDRDQDAFRAAMDNGTVVPVDLATSRIAQAHAYFVKQITEWADVTGDPDKLKRRLNALVRTLRDHLKMVVIDLEAGDNAQVIFETLNHRGAPLLAADLIKNLIFQLAQAQQLDVLDLYRRHWRPLDGNYWRELLSQGRLYRPRIDVFLNYWLTMKLRREVASDRVYADFRDFIIQSGPGLADLIAEISTDADVFARLDKLPADSVEGRFYYRVIRAMDTGTVTPVLLWLLRWSEQELPTEQRHRVLRAIESWLARRMLARLTAKGLNLVLLDLLNELAKYGPAAAGEVTEQFLAAQTADARLWPDDDTIRTSLATERVYKTLVRQRVRMVLEVLEDDLRSDYGEGQSCPHGLSIEHVMPQAWREQWPQATDDEMEALRRDQAVQRLGNLTLVSGKLNPAMSNRPWTKPDGKDKRTYLLEHSHLKLNAQLVAQHATEWTDADIAERTAAMTERLIAIWPRPQSATRTVVPPTAYEPEEEAEAVVAAEDDGDDAGWRKYAALQQWLETSDESTVTVSFADLEQITGTPLPPSARRYVPYWYGTRRSGLARAVRDAGWKASGVDLDAERVTFIKSPTSPEQIELAEDGTLEASASEV